MFKVTVDLVCLGEVGMSLLEKIFGKIKENDFFNHCLDNNENGKRVTMYSYKSVLIKSKLTIFHNSSDHNRIIFNPITAPSPARKLRRFKMLGSNI